VIGLPSLVVTYTGTCTTSIVMLSRTCAVAENVQAASRTIPNVRNEGYSLTVKSLRANANVS